MTAFKTVGELGGYPGYPANYALRAVPAEELQNGDLILYCEIPNVRNSASRWRDARTNGPSEVGVTVGAMTGKLFTVSYLRESKPGMIFYCAPRDTAAKDPKWNSKCGRCGANTFALFTSVERHEGSCK